MHLFKCLLLIFLSVAPGALLAADVDQTMTGAWFDPEHRGEGFLVEVLDEDSAVVYWFTYDLEGQQRWFVGQGVVDVDTIVVDELLAGSGAKFGEAFDPNEVVFTDAGELSIRWLDCSTANAQYTVDGVTGSQSLTRLTETAGFGCDSSPQQASHFTGSWYDTTHQGEGLVIEALPGGQALVFWFSYDPDGNPAWFYGLGDRDEHAIAVSEMYSTQGGIFGESFDPEAIEVLSWGSVLVELGCDSGKLDYAAESQQFSAGKLTLLRLTNPGSVDCQEPAPPNILLVIVDDVGKDSSSQYPDAQDPPDTPVLDTLANNGLVFENAWSNPTCSPTRAGILTGKYGFRTGVLVPEDSLSVDEFSLQSYIRQHLPGRYSDAVIGKWHLGPGRDNQDHPADLGISHFSGILGGGVDDYENWTRTTNGERSSQNGYITTVLVNEAIDWISEQQQSWFLWLAFNAPHSPFHLPPAELHDRNLPGGIDEIEANPRPYYLAAIEAVDTELGRLLESMDQDTRQNTLIIFMGDNGTPGQVVQAPFARRKAKGSLYQGGINVPFFVSGAGVSRQGEREEALVNTTDLFATIASIAGVNVDRINDSHSIAGLLQGQQAVRSHQYSESDGDSGWEWAVSDGDYKLIDFNGALEMYDLRTDPFESENLLENGPVPAGVLETLESVVDELHGDP